TNMGSTNDLLGFDTMGFDPAHPEFDPFGCYENFSRWTCADGSQAQAGSASGSSGGPIIVENAAPQVRQTRTLANEFTAQAGSASGSSGGPIPATDPLEHAAPQVRTYWQPGLAREAVSDGAYAYTDYAQAANRMRRPLPAPKSQGAPVFDGHDVQEFLDTMEMVGD
ncbi:hypothetical protein H0H93_015633, partial [Arthromyces matolae]